MGDTRVSNRTAGRAVGRVREGAPSRRNPAHLVGEDLIAQLQTSAGNRAVAAMLSKRTVQRHVGPTLEAEVGSEPAPGTEPVPGTGTGTEPAPAAPTKTRKELIEAQMGTTDSGKWALDVISKNSVTVDYEYVGTGSFHSEGKIYLNKTTPVIPASIAMMHEAQHALTFKTGKAADVKTLTREAFIKAKIADEAEAVVRAIEGAAPTLKAGSDIAGSGLTAGLVKQYQDAHAAEVKKLTDADPKIAAADAASKARTTVRDGKVTKWFDDGTFVTSTGSITYQAHYGKTWDDEHKPPAAPATPAPTTTPTPVINA